MEGFVLFIWRFINISTRKYDMHFASQSTTLFVISGFRRDADEICALLGYYAASNGNPLPTFP
jgi:hypothetical protein